MCPSTSLPGRRRNAMTKRGITIAPVLITALVLSAVVVSSASGTPPLSCYQAIEPSEGTAGDFSNPTCTSEVAALKGAYVLGEPLTELTKESWCAKITQTPVSENEKTGVYNNSSCSEKKVNGSFAEIIVTESVTLPHISITLSGSAYPLHLNYESTNVGSELETTAGGLLKAEGLKFLLLLRRAAK